MFRLSVEHIRYAFVPCWCTEHLLFVTSGDEGESLHLLVVITLVTSRVEGVPLYPLEVSVTLVVSTSRAKACLGF